MRFALDNFQFQWSVHKSQKCRKMLEKVRNMILIIMFPGPIKHPFPISNRKLCLVAQNT